MHDELMRPMTPENVEEFDVRIFESPDLVISVALTRSPWSVFAENYDVRQSAQ